MLKRIYINNFRGLVNFELSLDSINLFLGPNGSGKSTVFDVLRKIQGLVSGGHKVAALFSETNLTRWQKSTIQNFELEVEGNGGTYKYELGVEFTPGRQLEQQARLYYERLWFDNKPLLKLEEPPKGNQPHLADAAQLYRDDHSKSQVLPLSRYQSVVALLPPRNDNTRLIWFREYLDRLIIVQPNPMMMTGDSSVEETHLTTQMENFASWYRHIYQDQGLAIKITNALTEILDGFEHFRFTEAGEQHRILKLSFSDAQRIHKSIEYRFDELSDGQRMLIALYTLIYAAPSGEYTLCIDEPENFLALSEIQPWLTTIYDFCSTGEIQALLISHHPELIDYLASSAGYWFEYQSNVPVRVKRITGNKDAGLPMSELVARGWLYD